MGKHEQKQHKELEERLDIENKVFFRLAEEEFYKKYSPLIEAHGYNLQRGEGWLGDEPIIFARAKYKGSTSRRYLLFGLPRAQRRMKRLIPHHYSYADKTFAVSFLVQSEEEKRELPKLFEKVYK